MLPHCHKLVFVRVFVRELNQEKAELPLPLISQKVELMILVIVNDISYEIHLVQLIEVNLFVSFLVKVVTIFRGGDYELLLGRRDLEKGGH